MSGDRGSPHGPVSGLPSEQERADLRADCQRCFGLCCVALAFSASADFAIDKASGEPCPNLQADFRCSIHDRLRQSGFPGCTAYDCFGAGQKVSQETFRGRDWRQVPGTGGQMVDVFLVMRQLHELLWYLSEALEQPRARAIHADLQRVLDETDRLTRATPEALLALDVAAQRERVAALLRRTSQLVRGETRHPRKIRAGADLVGASLRGADLRSADLRGAYLIGADLREADLRGADLLGADLRDADLSGADLRDSLFLTTAQVGAARGNGGTRLPASLDHPAHWALQT